MDPNTHPIRTNPHIVGRYPNLRPAELTPEALAAYGALPNLAGNMVYGPAAARMRQLNPKPWEASNWDISQYGDADSRYNVHGFVPNGDENHMALQAAAVAALNSGNAPDKDIDTFAHESLHGIMHTRDKGNLSTGDAEASSLAKQKFLEDNWYRLPEATKQKYGIKFDAVLAPRKELYTTPMGTELRHPWKDKATGDYQRYWNTPIGPSIPKWRDSDQYDVDHPIDRDHLINYIVGAQAPYILRGERHPDLHSPSDAVFTAAKAAAGYFSIPELIREYRNQKASTMARDEAQAAAMREYNQPKGTRPR